MPCLTAALLLGLAGCRHSGDTHAADTPASTANSTAAATAATAATAKEGTARMTTQQQHDEEASRRTDDFFLYDSVSNAYTWKPGCAPNPNNTLTLDAGNQAAIDQHY